MNIYNDYLEKLIILLKERVNIENIIIALIFFILGCFFYHIVFIVLLPNKHKIYTWLFSLRNHSKLGKPAKPDIFLKRKGYYLGYSKKRKSAIWVTYTLSKKSTSLNIANRSNFLPDPNLKEKFKVRPEEYNNTGFDKGHLAPSSSIDYSFMSNKETFYMSNIVPQNPRLNRQAWGSLESLIRKWTKQIGKLNITTGPIYGERNQRINNNIIVPRGFFKVIYSFKYKKSIAFIFPNQDIKANEIWLYAFSVRDLEKEMSWKFFSKLGRKGNKIKKKLEINWWKNI